MAQSLKKFNFTDEEIEKLFDKDDNSSLELTEEDNESFVPDEIDAAKETPSIDRPDNYAPEVHTLYNVPNNSVQITPDAGVRRMITEYKRDLYEEDAAKERKLKDILNGRTPLNLYNVQNQCTHHAYTVSLIDMDKVYASCKYCSAAKTFTVAEWQRYVREYSQY